MTMAAPSAAAQLKAAAKKARVLVGSYTRVNGEAYATVYGQPYAI